MIKINSSIEEALRTRVSLGKIFTVRHFMAEQVPRRTIYNILERRNFPPEKKQRIGRIVENMTKVQHNKLKKAFDHKDSISQRQAAKKFDSKWSQSG